MAGVVVTMSGDEARLFRAMAKVLEQQDKLNNKLKETGKTSEDTGRKSRDAFEKSGLSLNKMSASLISYAAGIASVTGAVQLLRSGWEAVRKEQEAGLNQLQRTQGQDRRLLQISGNAQEFDQMRAQADQLAGQFGVDRAVVREVIFSAVSENFRDAVPAIIAASQVVDPQSAAGVAGQAPALFKGTIGALEAVNLTLKAAQASRLDFEQIARILPQAAEGGSIARSTAEETLAVLSVLASEFKSGDTAADRIKMFATRAGISEEFAGQGILGPLEKLMAMDEQTRRAYLGDSQELNVAYVKMSENIDLIKQRVSEFEQETAAFAAGGGMLASQTAIAAADPRSIAIINEARARQQLESSQADISGTDGAAGSAAALKAQKMILADGSFGARIFSGVGSEIVARLMTSAGYSPEQAAEIGADASGRLGNLVPGVGAYETFQYLKDAAASMMTSSKDLKVATGSLQTNSNAARAQANSAGGF